MTWVGSKAMVAFSVAKLTLAELTPGTRRRARSLRGTQVAQVMPVMGSSTIWLSPMSP